MAAKIVKHPETQRQCLSQLGVFSKLPTEIRLMIWEALFPDSRKPLPPRKYRRPVPPTKMANILRSSSFLYHEIRTLLYRNLEFRFIINQGRVKFQATSRTLQIDWRFDSAWDMNKFHSTFPFSNISTPYFEIEIRGAKNPWRGSIFTQWAMVNRVVEFVERLPIPTYVHVNFVKNWVEDGFPRKDIHRLQLELESLDTELEDTQDTQLERCPLTDYDVLILPFTTSSLTSWHYTLPAELRFTVLEDPDALNLTRLHIFKLDNPIQVDGSNEVYTTLEISETSQRHYIYEPCETSRTDEWVEEEVKDTFDDYAYSLVYYAERNVLEPTHDEIIEKLDETSRSVHWNYFFWPFLP